MISKKGDVTEIPLLLILVFFLAVNFLVVALAIDHFKDVVETTALNQTDVSTDIADSLDKISTTTIQRAFVMIFVFLVIGTMISSFLIRIHPIWMFIYIIFLGVTVFVGIFLANTYQDLTETTPFLSIAAEQTMTNYIMQYSIPIIIAVGALSMIVTFSKIFGQGGFTETRL